MKVTSSESNIGYDPHSITITFESAKEAEVVYCLFNHAKIAEFLCNCGIDSQKIKHAIASDAPFGTVDYREIWEDFVKLIEY